jgi:hypothetical protein
MVGLAVVALLGLVFVVLPTVLVRPNTELDREKLLKARNDVRTAGIQIVGGTALLAGLVFTNRTLGLNQQGQITDRFTKATDQLGSDRLAIRLGGIYSLERIARDSKADHGPVMEVLTAFVRDHAAASPTATASPLGPSTTTAARPMAPTDVQAVLTVVGRRNVRNDPNNFSLDLTHSNLSGANLSGANLSGANLSGTDLSGTDLRGADLFQATLSNANLSGANLLKADLSGAKLIEANLFNANLFKANLAGAKLIEATLSNANLFGVDISEADVSGANLSGAVNLTQDQVDSAFTSETTKLPPELHLSTPKS